MIIQYDTDHQERSVVRVQDGTDTTHSALGIVTLDDGRSYRFYAARSFDRSGYGPKRVSYGVALYSGGRSVPFNALTKVRDAITADFRTQVQAWASQALAA